MKLTGWGKYPIINAKISTPSSLQELVKQIAYGNVIARGNGRSYGDSAISVSNTIDMKGFNRLLEFNKVTGQLVAESGVLLSEVIDTFLPRGWFPKVTPGTKFVTLGGMVASDVHGKNHHKDGSFSNFVDWLDVIGSDGLIKRCSREQNSELFNWTFGGMGLTGIILNVAFRLQSVSSSWIKQRTISTTNIEHTIDVFEETLSDATYSVAWIDCLSSGNKLGRSIVILGDHAKASGLPHNKIESPLVIKPKKKMKIPINILSFVLNNLTVKIFNSLYYWMHKSQKKDSLVDWDAYFYQLDSILNWNEIYGHQGFAQFQCVIPLKNSKKAMKELLQAISKVRAGSFLAVLKRLGYQDSYFSFPMEGYTLALDFSITKKNLALMNELDKITLKNNGRFYLVKDSRMSSDIFHKSDSRIEDFKEFKRRNGSKTFSSAQSERLKL